MRQKLPPLRALVAFEAVTRLGGASAAARELGVTHGAVSKQLALLEDWCGRPLFRRADGRLYPTDAAQRSAEALGALFDAIAEEGETLRGRPARGLTVVAHATFALRWLVPRLPRWRAGPARGRLHLQTMHTADDWRALAGDVVVRRNGAPPRGWRGEEVMREALALAAAPQLARRVAERGPAALRDEEVIESETRPGELDAWLAATGMTRGDLAPAAQFGHFYLALEAAISGLGFVVAPLPVIDADIAAGRLALPWPEVTVPGAVYVAAMRPDCDRTAEAAGFIRWLRDEADPVASMNVARLAFPRARDTDGGAAGRLPGRPT
jgi:DNA-binding transcriptional LysR family regulator